MSPYRGRYEAPRRPLAREIVVTVAATLVAVLLTIGVVSAVILGIGPVCR